jgi:DNA topoisomerase-1
LVKSLVIVESPAKAKTIQKYLGKGFTVEASLGHVKDLPKSTLGVDTSNEFETDYVVIPGKEKVLAKLKKLAGAMDAIYLAPDPDREGEAIAAHLAGELDGNGAKAKKGRLIRMRRHASSGSHSMKLPSGPCRRRSSIPARSTKIL